MDAPRTGRRFEASGRRRVLVPLALALAALLAGTMGCDSGGGGSAGVNTGAGGSGAGGGGAGDGDLGGAGGGGGEGGGGLSACPFPPGSHTATRDGDPGDVTELSLEVSADGAITEILDAPCSPVETRQTLVDLYTGSVTCFASLLCGECVYFVRHDHGVFLVGNDSPHPDSAPSCATWAGAQFELPGSSGGGGGTDPWFSKSCAELGGTATSGGACVVKCTTDASCPAPGMWCPDTWKICRKSSCTQAADCGPGWMCTKGTSGTCAIPCAKDTAKQPSPGCPAGWPCHKDAVWGELWCTPPSGIFTDNCSDCLQTCKGLPGCCTGDNCMCEKECK